MATEEAIVLNTVQPTDIDERERRDQAAVGPDPSPEARRLIPSAFLVLWVISLVMVLAGAPWAGLGMAFATTLGWLLVRSLPDAEDV